ncbi:hypothetical protein PSR1_01217 [Anaeromyxobacter sp. PSR-1]|nr:hypothetical protein PSR1_01217 [Anaeromyxobacter sp. PSR-1]
MARPATPSATVSFASTFTTTNEPSDTVAASSTATGTRIAAVVRSQLSCTTPAVAQSSVYWPCRWSCEITDPAASVRLQVGW